MAGKDWEGNINALRTECCNFDDDQSCCGCFPGDSVVTTEAGGRRRISELAIGDRVLAARPDGSTFFDDVYLFGHKDAAVVTSFVKLETASGAVLRLTGDHHVPVRRAGAALVLPSAAVQVGDLVRVVGDANAALEPVASKSIVQDRGLFNPYTLSGTIVVDGVVASSHSSSALDGLFAALGVSIPDGYQAAFAPLRALYRLVGARRFASLEYIIDAVAEVVNGERAAAVPFAGGAAAATACAVAAAAGLVAAQKRVRLA